MVVLFNVDVLHHVIEFLDATSIYKLAQVEPAIGKYIRSRPNSIFKRLCINDFGVEKGTKDLYVQFTLESITSDLEKFLSFVYSGWSNVQQLARKMQIMQQWGGPDALRPLDPFVRRIHNRLFFYESACPRPLQFISSLLIQHGATFTMDDLVSAMDVQDLRAVKWMVRRNPNIVHEFVVDDLPLVFYLAQARALYAAFNLKSGRPRRAFISKVIKLLVKAGAATHHKNMHLKNYYLEQVAHFQNQLLFFKCQLSN
jgi:hypothetical protein